MAFCKFCGKQIPEGGSCDCAASQGAEEIKETAENAQNTVENAADSAKEKAESAVDKAKDTAAELKDKAGDVADKVGDSLKQGATKVDDLAGELSEKLPGGMKNNKNAVYAAGAVILLLLICLLCLLFGGGVKSTVKKYVNSASDKKGGKTFYSLSYPDAVIDALKDEDEFDDMVEDFNDNVEDMIDELEDDETAPKFDKILRKEKLKNSQIKAAEEYFENLCETFDADDDIEISKGYEVKVRIEYKDEDGDRKHSTEKICVVKIKGDGWKVIPHSADSLD